MTEQVRTALIILRRKQVENRTGLSRSSIYLKISKKEFPPPVSLGARAVGWLESEINDWIGRQVDQRGRGA